MAYASLLSLTQTIDQIINTLHPPHQVEDLLVSLQEKANFLLSFLDISLPQNNDKIRGFENRIRDAAYQAEDILNQSQNSPYQNQILPVSGLGEDGHETESYMANQTVKEQKHCRGLQKAIEELASVAQELVKIKKKNQIYVRLQPSNNTASRSTRSTRKSILVGMDEYLLMLKGRLTFRTDKLEVLSIVGMGGSGKTTLARLVYDDVLIASHFDIRAWITVSQVYRMHELLKGLLSSIRDPDLGSVQQFSTEKLAENIAKSLKGKRYLMVMDDVWNIEAFNQLNRLFPANNNGSRILLTTRLNELALHANPTVGPLHLRFLSDDESFNLLCEMACVEESCPMELLEWGKMIASRCRGLPLALVTVGGLLSKAERSVEYWKYVVSAMDSGLGHEQEMVSVLEFAYDQLPHHLKACLLYMGIFPEDYQIFRSRVTKLWVANGFIRPDRVKTLEEVAEEYLNDLIHRNLVTVREWSFSGEIKSCSIHDLIRDFCIRKAEKELFLHADHFPEIANKMSHVSIHRKLNHQIHRSALANGCSAPVRSLSLFSGNSSNNIRDLITSFWQLRVLDVITIMFDEFPAEIVELVTLKYIALTFWLKHRIPASISKLCNLETLIVNPGKFRSIFNTAFLPPEIWKMPRLRHLLFMRCFVPYPTDELKRGNFVHLENLQTFGNVINFRWTKEVVEMTPNLKKLVITYKHDGRTEWSSYSFDNFVHLHKLETLKCYFFGKSYMKCQDPLPVNFSFPQKLRRLTLSGCRISWENITVVGSLPYLEVLKLKFHSFEGPVWESKDGEFCQLRFLLIHMTDLELWKVDRTHFPRLERLSLRYCYNLVEIPKIPNLQEIELCECSESVMTSARDNAEEQQSWGTAKFKVVLKKGEDTSVSS